MALTFTLSIHESCKNDHDIYMFYLGELFVAIPSTRICKPMHLQSHHATFF
jgi:hypothetical protein